MTAKNSAFKQSFNSLGTANLFTQYRWQQRTAQPIFSFNIGQQKTQPSSSHPTALAQPFYTHAAHRRRWCCCCRFESRDFWMPRWRRHFVGWRLVWRKPQRRHLSLSLRHPDRSRWENEKREYGRESYYLVNWNGIRTFKTNYEVSKRERTHAWTKDEGSLRNLTNFTTICTIKQFVLSKVTTVRRLCCAKAVMSTQASFIYQQSG